MRVSILIKASDTGFNDLTSVISHNVERDKYPLENPQNPRKTLNPWFRGTPIIYYY